MTLRLFLSLWLVALVVPAWAVKYGDVEVRLAVEPLGDHLHGYTEYLFAIDNKGDQPHVVELTLPDDRNGVGASGGSLGSVRRSVEVPAKRTVMLGLAYPARPLLLGRDVRVTIDGQRMQDLVPLAPRVAQNHWGHGGGGRHGWGRAMPMPARGDGVQPALILYSQGFTEAFFQVTAARAADGGVRGGLDWGGPRGIVIEPGGGMAPPGAPPGAPRGDPLIPAINSKLVRSTVPVSAWSDNWLGYSRYDTILLTPSDINELTVSSEYTRRVLRAIWRFAEAGGVVVVVGGPKPPLPKAWDRPGARDAASGWTVHGVGFGVCLHQSEGNSQKWGREDWMLLQQTSNTTSNPWMSEPSTRDLNESFPVVDDLGVPVGGMYALMFLFAIVIGPVNLVLLSRIKRRIWMLWTVPTISALTCFFVLGYMILAEGWSGHARVAGVTLLDQIEERATTLGRVGYYSPLTPSDGLRFAEDVELSAYGSDHSTSENSCALNWVGQQHFARGWVTARVPTHYRLRRSETQTKQRLVVTRNRDGEIHVVNALGTDISQLALADEKGQVFVADGKIPAGQEAVLKRRGNDVVNRKPFDAYRSLYTQTNWGVVQTIQSYKEGELLVPNSYSAVLDQTPFLEQGLGWASRKTSSSLLLGVFGDIPAK